jgi:hypothetical protein
MIPQHEITELDRDTAIVAHEAIINLLVNDWSAMNRNKLKEAERELADSLDIDAAYPDE